MIKPLVSSVFSQDALRTGSINNKIYIVINIDRNGKIYRDHIFAISPSPNLHYQQPVVAALISFAALYDFTWLRLKLTYIVYQHVVLSGASLFPGPVPALPSWQGRVYWPTDGSWSPFRPWQWILSNKLWSPSGIQYFVLEEVHLISQPYSHYPQAYTAAMQAFKMASLLTQC